MTNPVSNNLYSVATGTNSNSVSITYVTNRSPMPSDVQFPVQKRWINSVTEEEFFLINFISSDGIVTANWIPLGAGSSGSLSTLAANSGGFISPTSGNINIVGDGETINMVGNQGTSTITANVLLPGTAHQVLIGETSSIAGVSPGSTSGVPMVSNGTSADPSFSTALVVGGGTGATSFSPYAVVCGGTSSTSQLQNVSGVGTIGQVLVSNGASNLPSWKSISTTQAFDQIHIQAFTTSGTYTPTSGMVWVIIELVAGGGGGGGGSPSSAGIASAGGGGGAGGYARSVFSATTIGVSQTVTIGAGGTAGANTGGNGGTGGSTSVGSLISATGGSGGTGSTAANVVASTGGAGGVGTGTVAITGQSGFNGLGLDVPTTGSYGNTGAGGSTVFGAGGQSVLNVVNTNTSGNAGAMGGGGSGGTSNNSGTGAVGGAGGAGYVVITEFLSV